MFRLLLVRPRRLLPSHVRAPSTFLPSRGISSTLYQCSRFARETLPDDDEFLAEQNMEEVEEYDDDDEYGGEDEEVNEATDDGEVGSTTYSEFLEFEGQKFRYPSPIGPTWLGVTVPFPLNPTFVPPPPFSDGLKTTVYNAFAKNKVSLRELSTQYGISLQRLDAIIRLKDLERKWINGKPLQTGFLIGMESMLAVRKGGLQPDLSDEINTMERREVTEADQLATQLAREEGTSGLSRIYYESFDEGEVPVVARLLEERRTLRGERSAKREYPSHIVETSPGRPSIRFVDVGLRWFDSKEAAIREKASAHRKAVKARKHGKITLVPPTEITQPPNSPTL